MSDNGNILPDYFTYQLLKAGGALADFEEAQCANDNERIEKALQRVQAETDSRILLLGVWSLVNALGCERTGGELTQPDREILGALLEPLQTRKSAENN